MARIDRRKFNSREDILDAAQRVTAREGAANLTIDAVAREAEMSKGGVLYNFPSKEALLKGMLERFIQEADKEAEAQLDQLHGTPNATLRCALAGMTRKCRQDTAINTALLAAAAQDPQLLDPIRAMIRDDWGKIEKECADATMAALIWSASIGILFQSLLDLAPFAPEREEAVVQRMDDIAKTI